MKEIFENYVSIFDITKPNYLMNWLQARNIGMLHQVIYLYPYFFMRRCLNVSQCQLIQDHGKVKEYENFRAGLNTIRSYLTYGNEEY